MLQTPAQNETEYSPWLKEGDDKSRAVQQMFGEIAESYDRLNRLFSFNLDRRWRQFAVQQIQLQPGESVLDMCCGTGDFLPILRRAVGPSGQILGMDFSLPMLRQSPGKEPQSSIALADACNIPLRAEAVDAVTVGWGIRNVPDMDKAHAEIFRVLRPGGRFVSVDMAIPENPLLKGVSTWAFRNLVPWVGAKLSQAEAYRYLPESTQRFASRKKIAESMERAGFSDVRWHNCFFGNICLHWGRKS